MGGGVHTSGKIKKILRKHSSTPPPPPNFHFTYNERNDLFIYVNWALLTLFSIEQSLI